MARVAISEFQRARVLSNATLLRYRRLIRRRNYSIDRWPMRARNNVSCPVLFASHFIALAITSSLTARSVPRARIIALHMRLSRILRVSAFRFR